MPRGRDAARLGSYVDVYGPRPIATTGLIRIDGHNCRRISGFLMRLDNVSAASLDGFRPLPPQRPRDIGVSRAGPHIRFGKRRGDRFAISCHLLQLPGETSFP